MKTSQMHLQVIQAVRAQKETADGLGDWQASELDIAMQWRPALATGLRIIYDGAEAFGDDERGVPAQHCTSYTARGDKPGETRTLPLAKRPLTGTERLFRTWESTRTDAVMQWHEEWLHDGVCGGRKGRSRIQCYAQTVTHKPRWIWREIRQES